ncbi:hypothetical protein N7527_000639 [Penicillium freii]|nr:hypothetical protein N7527_000639 [Penicillium freii]
MSEIDHHRNSHPEWIKEFNSAYGICGEGFRTQQLLAAHEGHKHPEMRATGFVKPEFRCQFYQGTFTRLNSFNSFSGHMQICIKNPQTERRERKGIVRGELGCMRTR